MYDNNGQTVGVLRNKSSTPTREVMPKPNFKSTQWACNDLGFKCITVACLEVTLVPSFAVSRLDVGSSPKAVDG
ncbi:hypothetical protein CLCR_11117 [Cladophialophora carrionii]|uniref:Uncharacterized protein n=1 Tax=Cladophialophora carrionii TaxID=86049 RepID=A0A1C1CZR6_9EURO|nr:hypothetical protein CLCR_11117 [Cladophialophora carrionii]